jgi:hypothetical protein
VVFGLSTGETDEEAQDLGLAFDDNLNLDVNDIEIEEDDQVFIPMVYLVNPQYFIHASSTVFKCLAKTSAKNSQLKGFYETVLTALHSFFSKTAFDTLPQCQK